MGEYDVAGLLFESPSELYACWGFHVLWLLGLRLQSFHAEIADNGAETADALTSTPSVILLIGIFSLIGAAPGVSGNQKKGCA